MGPNGIMSIETIAECRCETSCYRQQFNVALTELKSNEEGQKILSTKVSKNSVGKTQISISDCGQML